MKIYKVFLLFTFLLCTLSSYSSPNSNLPVWGFFAHRLINRMAVFTLPPEMIGFYKKNIDYISEHSVDPDKRRYSTKFEAPRHFIDMENYGTYPFESLPRTWNSFLATYADVFIITDAGDSLKVMGKGIWLVTGNEYKLLDEDLLKFLAVSEYSVTKKQMNQFINSTVEKTYADDNWDIPVDSLRSLFPGNNVFDKVSQAFSNSDFTLHGILPYNLEHNYRKLVKAFINKDVDKILRYSSEIGHYIGDAHVPLHTSKNYNGQLTGQEGIHAFWESRIPELFAEKEFDFLVGKASYIDNLNGYIWKIIFDSHKGVQVLLDQELQLKTTYPLDKQYCYDNRTQLVVRTQCQEYAAAYNLSLEGQVEERLRSSIISVGSIWYTAWLEAGQPDLNTLGGIVLNEEGKKYFEQLERNYQRDSEGFGRQHE